MVDVIGSECFKACRNFTKMSAKSLNATNTGLLVHYSGRSAETDDPASSAKSKRG